MISLVWWLPNILTANVLQHPTWVDALAYAMEHPPQGIHEGRVLPFPALADALAQNRVVFVGEVHDRYDHHLNQLALLQALHQRNPNLAIGVEWFQQPFQLVLNDFLVGKISEAELLRRSEYFDRWRYDYRLLRPILEYAKANRLPILALNAPVELTRKVSSGGLDALAPNERAQLPEISPPDSSYEARLKKIFAQHSRSEGEFDHFMLVQRIWDETMANNVVRYLKTHPQHQMVVFSGSGHISFGAGIPHDVAQQLPGISLATVVSSDPQDIEPEMVDYFLPTQMLELPPTGKLGVWLKSAPDGVRIGTLQPDSAAKRAGLQQGDKIIGLNATPIRNMADLMLALTQYPPATTVEVTVQREGEVQALIHSVVLQ